MRSRSFVSDFKLLSCSRQEIVTGFEASYQHLVICVVDLDFAKSCIRVQPRWKPEQQQALPHMYSIHKEMQTTIIRAYSALQLCRSHSAAAAFRPCTQCIYDVYHMQAS
jgi:hypothetical protein